MVTGGDWTRDPHARPHWPQDRFSGADQPSEEARHQEQQDARRQPPLDIERALREHCNIPVRHYFVAAILDNGNETTFSGPERYNVTGCFNWPRFRRQAMRIDSGLSATDEADWNDFRPQGPGYSGTHTERREGYAGADDGASRPRKRKTRRHDYGNDSASPATLSKAKRGLVIGDSKEVWAFYDQRFRNSQQSACKLIAKGWVKTVEPKKQTNHPYTGAEDRAPQWWPKPWGTTKEEKVRHKEPDHLYKKERLHLLCHILRLVVEPKSKQLPCLQRLDLNVETLKSAADEALSEFYTDKDNKGNAQKKLFVDEIFKVARQEERYKRGEIDGDTKVWVMADDKFPEHYPSDVEGEDAAESATSLATAPSTKTFHDNLVHGSNSEHQSPAGHISGGGAFANEMPHRGSAQYPTHLLPTGIQTDQHFVEGSGLHSPSPGLPLHDMVPAPPQDGSRRPSLYTATEYTSPSPANIYSQPWSAPAATPTAGSLYSFPPHQAAAQPGSQGQFNSPSSMQMPQNQYMATPYDNLARGQFDQGHMFRQPANAGQAPAQPSQAFPSYLGPDGRNLPGSGAKPDGQPRGPLP